MDSGPVSLGVTVSRQTGKKGKGKRNVTVDQYENQKVSNYDLLKKLGFDDDLIEENKRTGLKDKVGKRQYMIEMAD